MKRDSYPESVTAYLQESMKRRSTRRAVELSLSASTVIRMDVLEEFRQIERGPTDADRQDS